eukprot:TRINITY_DN10795_c0_g1_i2.p1 TRINITY_DN10795_c0_g1~~TRINITY_DN10795_c0_g1_i2.p1  ORF type:complete len:720 (+),score=108.56 TRINITY_DN10795_c0_g1_i2:53-2161(+)
MACLMLTLPKGVKCNPDQLESISTDLEYHLASNEPLVVVRDEHNKAIGYWFVRTAQNIKDTALSIQRQQWTCNKSKKKFSLVVAPANFENKQGALADCLPLSLIKRVYPTPVDYANVTHDCSDEERERILKQWKDKGFNYDDWFVPYFYRGDGRICTRFNHRQNKGCTRNPCRYSHECFLCGKHHGCFDPKCTYNERYEMGMENLMALGYDEKALADRLFSPDAALARTATPISPVVAAAAAPPIISSPKPAPAVQKHVNDAGIAKEMWQMQSNVLKAQQEYRQAEQSYATWEATAKSNQDHSRRTLQDEIAALEQQLQQKRQQLRALNSQHQHAQEQRGQPKEAAQRALAQALEQRRELTLSLVQRAISKIHTTEGLHSILSAFMARDVTLNSLSETTLEQLAHGPEAQLTSFGIVAFGPRRRCHLLLQRIAQGQGVAPVVGHGWDCLAAATWVELNADSLDTDANNFAHLFLRYDVDGEVLFHLTADDLLRTFELSNVSQHDVDLFLQRLQQERQHGMRTSSSASLHTTPLLTAATPPLFGSAPSRTTSTAPTTPQQLGSSTPEIPGSRFFSSQPPSPAIYGSFAPPSTMAQSMPTDRINGLMASIDLSSSWPHPSEPQQRQSPDHSQPQQPTHSPYLSHSNTYGFNLANGSSPTGASSSSTLLASAPPPGLAAVDHTAPDDPFPNGGDSLDAFLPSGLL